MTDKKYTHKIVMYDVNGLVRTAVFADEREADLFFTKVFGEEFMLVKDSEGSIFNIANIVQINPVEVIEGC